MESLFRGIETRADLKRHLKTVWPFMVFAIGVQPLLGWRILELVLWTPDGRMADASRWVFMVGAALAAVGAVLHILNGARDKRLLLIGALLLFAGVMYEPSVTTILLAAVAVASLVLGMFTSRTPWWQGQGAPEQG